MAGCLNLSQASPRPCRQSARPRPLALYHQRDSERAVYVASLSTVTGGKVQSSRRSPGHRFLPIVSVCRDRPIRLHGCSPSEQQGLRWQVLPSWEIDIGLLGRAGVEFFLRVRGHRVASVTNTAAGEGLTPHFHIFYLSTLVS